MKPNTYAFVFAAIVCVICSIMLSAVSEGLRPQQELNAVLDVKKNILKAIRLRDPLPPKISGKEVFKIFESKIEELVIDDQGNIVEGKRPHDIKDTDKGLYPLYIYKEGDKVMGYCYPISGFGLWSALYGYLAIEPDATTVRGITFYKHGETPGLGAEIEKDWFQQNFIGKTIWSTTKNEITPIEVVKGKVSARYTDERVEHAVDGISAATITGNGVTKLLHKWIRAYEPFFQKLRAGLN